MAKNLVEAKVVYVDKKKKSSFRGFVNVKVGKLVSFSVRIVEGKKGLFVSYPSIKDEEGEYQSVVCPCSKESAQYLTDVIMETWEEEVGKPKTKKSKKSKHDEDDEDEEDDEDDGFIASNDDLPF